MQPPARIPRSRRPVPPQETFADFLFPIQGIDLSQGYNQQRPRTTPVGQNVRAYEPGTNRARGGQRPGVNSYIAGTVNGNFNIQDINAITDATGTGGGSLPATVPNIWTRGPADSQQIGTLNETYGSGSNVFSYGLGGLCGSTIAAIGFRVIGLAGTTAGAKVWAIVLSNPAQLITTGNIPGPQTGLYLCSVSTDGTKYFLVSASGTNLYVQRLTTAGASDYSVTNATGDGALDGGVQPACSFSLISGGIIYTVWTAGYITQVKTLDGSPNAPMLLMTPTGLAQNAPGYVVAGQGVNPPGMALIGSVLAVNVVNAKTGQGGVVFVNISTGAFSPAPLLGLANSVQNGSLTTDGTFWYALFGDDNSSTTVKINSSGASVWNVAQGVPGRAGVISYIVGGGGLGPYLFVSQALNTLTLSTVDGSVTGGGLGLGLLSIYDGGAVTPPALPAPGTDTIFNRNIVLLAASNGALKVARAGVWQSVTGGGTIFSGTPRVVRSAANNGKMYYVDSISYTVYDPLTNTISAWTPSQGTLPTDSHSNKCRLIETWRGRTVLSGLPYDGSNWFMSAVNDPNNWNYFPVAILATQAVSGNSAATAIGLLPDIITGIIPYTDDLLVLGGDKSIWIMRGDPMLGGQLDLVSDSVGMAWGRAWCRDPVGNLYFVSNRMGIYTLVPGNQPQRISQGIEQLTASIDLDNCIIRLAWDDQLQGMHVFVTHQVNPRPETHFFWELRTGAWWTDVFTNINHSPFCCYSYFGSTPTDRVCLIGSWDGHVRAFQLSAPNDEGTAITSTVLLGPLLTQNMDDLMLFDLQAIMATVSASVTYAVLIGETAEIALASQPVVTGTWGTGRIPLSFVKRSAYAHWIKLSATAPWAMESIRARIGGLGKVRGRAIKI